MKGQIYAAVEWEDENFELIAVDTLQEALEKCMRHNKSISTSESGAKILREVSEEEFTVLKKQNEKQ